MTRPLPGSLGPEGRSLEPSAITWRIVLDPPSGPTLYITNNNVPIVYEGQTYTPVPFEVGTIDSQSDGSLTSFKVTISNATKELVREIDANLGFIGNEVTVGILTQVDVDAGTAGVSLDYVSDITNVDVNEEAIVFTLGHFNIARLSYPSERFTASFCRYLEFGGVECGYPINIGNFSSCPRTLSACEERGKDEAALGQPVQHPARFGAFPGML